MEELSLSVSLFQMSRVNPWKSCLCMPRSSKRRGEIFGRIALECLTLPNVEGQSLEELPLSVSLFQMPRVNPWKNCLCMPRSYIFRWCKPHATATSRISSAALPLAFCRGRGEQRFVLLVSIGANHTPLKRYSAVPGEGTASVEPILSHAAASAGANDGCQSDTCHSQGRQYHQGRPGRDIPVVACGG